MIANSTVLESAYSENCSWYEGMCSSHLNHLKATNTNLTVIVNNDITEQQVFDNLERFSSFISKECSVTIMPFLCQYVYPPCDGNGNANFITQEQCMYIRDEVCFREWRLAMAIDLGSLLPVCEEIDFNNSISSLEEQDNTSASPIKCLFCCARYVYIITDSLSGTDEEHRINFNTYNLKVNNAT